MAQENARPDTGRIETAARIQRDTGDRGLSERIRIEARQRIAPIYLQSQNKGAGAAMFLAMSELQRLYPHLNEAELETLFAGVLREVERGTRANSPH